MHGAECFIASDWFKDYQALIGALLGFSGVMFTLWFNAKQTRLQETNRIKHQAASVRAVFIEELKLNKTLINSAINGFTEHGISIIEWNLIVYNQYVDKHSLLEPEEIQAIFVSYDGLRGLTSVIEVYCVDKGKGLFKVEKINRDSIVETLSERKATIEHTIAIMTNNQN